MNLSELSSQASTSCVLLWGMQDGSVQMTVPSTVKLFFNPTDHCSRALSATLCIQMRSVAFYPCVGAFLTLHGALNQYLEDINTFFEVLNWKKLVVEDPAPVGNPDTTKFSVRTGLLLEKSISPLRSVSAHISNLFFSTLEPTRSAGFFERLHGRLSHHPARGLGSKPIESNGAHIGQSG